MVNGGTSNETVVLKASKGVARIVLALYLAVCFVLPALILPFNFAFVLVLLGVSGCGVALYLRYVDMALVVGDSEVTVVNLFARHTLDTDSARVVVSRESAFWAEGELKQGSAHVLKLTDASERQVTVAVAPTLGDRYRSVIEDFNIAVARHRLAG